MATERYSRHYALKDFGASGQQKLQDARVLVVGAGGLGCPALQFLAAAGVGSLGIIDHDRIELSNLQRQLLYDSEDIGLAKATVAATKLRRLNPEVSIQAYVEQIHAKNAAQYLQDYDLVLDCTDNFAARYLLCDACKLLDKPLIFGAIYQYEGQLAVFNVADAQGQKTTYRHLFPHPPGPLEAPDCNTAGVLGVLPGIIGTMQATEAIKLLAGIGTLLSNTLMTINILDNSTLTLDIPRTMPLEGNYPSSLAALKDFDYISFCGMPNAIQEISPQQLIQEWRDPDHLLIDLRNAEEMPRLPVDHLPIPLATLAAQVEKINRPRVIFICQTGKRSLAAAQFLQQQYPGRYQIVHLAGGMDALQPYLHD